MTDTCTNMRTLYKDKTFDNLLYNMSDLGYLISWALSRIDISKFSKFGVFQLRDRFYLSTHKAFFKSNACSRCEYSQRLCLGKNK